jgi:pimeloyl-CoA synthetase
MKNQFFYTRISESGKPTRASFNVNKVIRTVLQEEDDKDDVVLVLLDDLHERSHDVQQIDVKTNKFKGIKRQRDVFQSEIVLSMEDAERFFKLTNIEN